MAKVLVAGVGMIPFAKPGSSAPYDEMGADPGLHDQAAFFAALCGVVGCGVAAS